MNQIINKLNELFENLDETVLENSKAWAHGRAAALREFRSSEEYQKIRRDAWTLYPRMYDIAGGKTWFTALNDTTKESIDRFVEKNCAATIAKRNATIAKKLAKAGVTDVISEEFSHSKDGFNGVFVVNTDSGTRHVIVETIFAGGYNIQCLHLRVLVNVK